MKRPTSTAVFNVAVLIPLIGVLLLWRQWWDETSALPESAGSRPTLASSTLAFKESYLDAASALVGVPRTDCYSCHSADEGLPREKWDRLRNRVGLAKSEWAATIQLPARCGKCHLVPEPATLSQSSWIDVIRRMDVITEQRHFAKLNADERSEISHYYYCLSPESHRSLDPDPDPAESPVRFEQSLLGTDPGTDLRGRPFLGHVEIADVDGDGSPDVLISDVGNSAVNWIHRTNEMWREDTLSDVPHPARARTIATSRGKARDIVIACLGTTGPTDDLVGSVVLLTNDGHMHFTKEKLVDGVSRVADAAPGDFDGDGDADFVFASYGYINEGGIEWLERKSDGSFARHPILKRAGAANVIPVDLDGDGRLDFVALFAQEHEEITLFLNEGNGQFRERTLFKATTPSFGSSGIQLVDLDQDGDMDILYTNGDNMDLATTIPRPFHGVQWLENVGNLKFVWHDIHRFYGAYCAVAGDINNDGKLDVVVTSMFNDWSDPVRASLVWFENDGRQHFKFHTIAREPVHLISAAVGDLDGDGRNDIVACGMNIFPPFTRMGRTTLWKNLGGR